MATSPAGARHSCAKLSVAVEDPKSAAGGAIFVKATWLPTRFSLAVTDGDGAWLANASDAEVRLRAEQWDQPVADYLALAERYLAFHQPSSSYSFHDAGDGHRRPAPNKQQTNAEILDFLMDANIRLSEEVVRKTQSFDKLKQESEKCLQQSERFNNEKTEFESATFSKFVAILNSKKAKLRQLKDRLAELEAADNAAPKEEEEDGEESSDKTEIFKEGSDREPSVKEEPSETGSGDHHSSPEKGVTTSRGRRGRKRTRK